MKEFVDTLIDILERETSAYRMIFQLLEKEAGAMGRCDLETLNEIILEKENEVQKIRVLEEQREKIVKTIAWNMGLEARTLSLTKISDRMDEGYSKRLKEISHLLNGFIQSVKALNKKNKKRVEHAMGLARESISMMENLMTPSPVYQQNGRFCHSSMHTGRLLCHSI